MPDHDPALEAAFEAHFRELVGPIRRYAARTVGDSAADDVVSETFSIAWRKWSEAPAIPGVRRAWTFRVAHNVIAHNIRAQMRRGQLLRRVASVHPAELADPADRVCGDAHTAYQLAALPLSEREALALVVFADMTPQQAAYALGCSVGALNSRLTRARKRFVDTTAPATMRLGVNP